MYVEGLVGDDYGWIITKDLIFDPAFDTKSAVGVIGPRMISPEIVAALRAGKGIRWRAFDDDNVLYYEGRYVGPDNDLMFQPLYDFAEPNAGAVYIQYWRPGRGGGWETL
jgi:hypothetical protein